MKNRKLLRKSPFASLLKDRIALNVSYPSKIALFTATCEVVVMKKTAIRLAKVEDIERIAEIGITAFGRAFINEKNKAEVKTFLEETYSIQRLEREISSGKLYYLYQLEEQVVGFILLSKNPPDPSLTNYLKIDRLYLDPNVIGQGFGLALMQFAEKQAILLDAQHMWLEVLRTNEKAINFYKKLGFKAFDQAPAKFIADNEIDIWMIKELAQSSN